MKKLVDKFESNSTFWKVNFIKNRSKDEVEKILTAKKINAKKSNEQTKKSLLQLLAILIIFASILPIGVETKTPILNVLMFILLAVVGITLLVVASRKKK